MVDFSKILSPVSLRRLENTRREMERLYGLSDRWLGEELLRLARRARAEHPDRLLEACRDTYDTSLVWEVVPEISRRLGSTGLTPDEGRRGDVRYADGPGLRCHAGLCLRFCSLGDVGDVDNEMPSAASLLLHEPANGNPVAMALDRLCPAPEKGRDAEDYIARQVREISKVRGFAETAVWWPGMQDWKRRDRDRDCGRA